MAESLLTEEEVEDILEWLDHSVFAPHVDGLYWGMSQEAFAEQRRKGLVNMQWGRTMNVSFAEPGREGLYVLELVNLDEETFHKALDEFKDCPPAEETAWDSGIQSWLSEERMGEDAGIKEYWSDYRIGDLPQPLRDRVSYLYLQEKYSDPESGKINTAEALEYLYRQPLVSVILCEKAQAVMFFARGAAMVRNCLSDEDYLAMAAQFDEEYRSLNGRHSGLNLEKSDLIPDKPEDLLMTMEENRTDFSRAGGTVIFHSNRAEGETRQYGYGYDYHLEVFADGYWQRILSSEQEGYLLGGWSVPLRGDSENFVDWGFYGGELPDGWYRLVKSAVLGDAVTGRESYTLAAPFVICQERFPDARFAAREGGRIYNSEAFAPPLAGAEWGMKQEKIKELLESAGFTWTDSEREPLALTASGEFLGIPADISFSFDNTPALQDHLGLETCTVEFTGDEEAEEIEDKLTLLLGTDYTTGKINATDPDSGKSEPAEYKKWKSAEGGFSEQLADRMYYIKAELPALCASGFGLGRTEDWKNFRATSLVEVIWYPSGRHLQFSGLNAALALAAEDDEAYEAFVSALQGMIKDWPEYDTGKKSSFIPVPGETQMQAYYPQAGKPYAGRMEIQVNFTLPENISDPSQFVFDDYYQLEVNSDGEWYELNPKEDFDRGKNKEYRAVDGYPAWNVDVSLLYGELPKGVYRMIKRVQNGEDYCRLSARFLVY